MNIEFNNKPNSINIDFLTQKINEETTDFGSAIPFAFFIRDELGKIIAGCVAMVVLFSGAFIQINYGLIKITATRG